MARIKAQERGAEESGGNRVGTAERDQREQMIAAVVRFAREYVARKLLEPN